MTDRRSDLQRCGELDSRLRRCESVNPNLIWLAIRCPTCSCLNRLVLTASDIEVCTCRNIGLGQSRLWIPSVSVNGAFTLVHTNPPGSSLCWWESDVIGTLTQRTYTASTTCTGVYTDVVADLKWEAYYLSGTTWHARLRAIGYETGFYGSTVAECDDVAEGVEFTNTKTCTGIANWGTNGTATLELPG